MNPSRRPAQSTHCARIFSACFAVLAACAAFAPVSLSAQAAPKQTSSNTPAFSNAQLDLMTRLRVHYQFDTVFLEKTGSPARWMVKGSGLAADDSMMAGARQLLAALHQGELVTRAKSEADLEPYGLDQVEAWGIEVGAGSRRPDYVLVSLNLEEQALYWKRAARPEVYRVRNAPWRLSLLADDWKSRHLLPPFSLFDIHTIDVTWSDAPAEIQNYKLLKVRKDSAVIVAPDTLSIHLRKAAEVFVLTEQFAIDDFFGRGESPTATNQAPWVSLKIQLEDGTVHALRTAGQSGLHYHVPHPRGGAMVRVSRFRFDKFKRTLAELTALPQFGPESKEWAVEEDLTGFGVYAPHKETMIENGSGHDGQEAPGVQRKDEHEGHDH